MASVDVVIPCYNYARYLQRCIETVLSQQGVTVRALIIDDASTDNTPEVASAIAAQDPRVEYRRHAKNMRHIATYNEGLLDWASADYSLLLSADDLLAPDALRRATRVMDLHPQVHMTYGMALLFCEDQDLDDLGDEDQPGTDSQTDYKILAGADFIRASVAGNPVPTPSAIVRTQMQRRIGGYSVTLPHTADMEMWMRFAAYADIGIVPQVLAYKRTHSLNMSIQYADRPLGDFRERVEACRELLSQHGAAMGSSAPSIDEIHQLIGRQVFWSASRYWDEGQTEACEQALRLAAELWPAVTESPEWRRLKLKRTLPRVVGELIGKVRGQAPNAETSPTGDLRLRQIGWWPEGDRAS